MSINSNKQAAVILPIYKPDLTYNEEISFDRCLKILGHNPIILIAPDNIDLSNYLRRNTRLNVISFEPEHFTSVQSYDRLMLTKAFYEKFLDYEYILISQLDSFVFSDRLVEWCQRGYDYIGAPWVDLPIIENIASTATRLRRLFPALGKKLNNSVGNGGFSLRRVKTFSRSLAIWENKARNWPYYEDTFWAFFVTSYNPFFRVPKFDEALQFAFERCPAKCYEMSGHQLPFGCHSWEKYDIEFWRPIFRDLGYEI